MASEEDYAKITPPSADGFQGDEWRAPNGLAFRLDKQTRTWWPKEWWDKKLEIDTQRAEAIAKTEAELAAKSESESN